MKRYAIVRVDGKCPIHTEKLSSQEIDGMFKCSYDDCSNCRYGDTKEQLIKKVATAIFRSEVKAYKKYYDITPMRIITRDAEAQCLKVAEEIVEFLGVEE